LRFDNGFMVTHYICVIRIRKDEKTKLLIKSLLLVATCSIPIDSFGIKVV